MRQRQKTEGGGGQPSCLRLSTTGGSLKELSARLECDGRETD